MATPVIKPKKQGLVWSSVVPRFFLKNIEDMDSKKGVFRDDFQYLGLTSTTEP